MMCPKNQDRIKELRILEAKAIESRDVIFRNGIRDEIVGIQEGAVNERAALKEQIIKVFDKLTRDRFPEQIDYYQIQIEVLALLEEGK